MGQPLTSRIPRKFYTPSQSTNSLESHLSDDIVTASKTMTPIAVPNSIPRFLLGATHFSVVAWCIVATAVIVISILSLFILCHFLRKRNKKQRGGDIVVDKCDVGGSYIGSASEEVSSICKEEEKTGPDVTDVESQMTSSNGAMAFSTGNICSLSASANILSPKEPSVSTTGSDKSLPNLKPSSSSSFCQILSHVLDSHSQKDLQSVERKDRTYQSSLSKFLESLRTYSSMVSADSRSKSANQDLNKETNDYSSSVSHHSINSVSLHGTKSGVSEFESTSDHGQIMQMDDLISLHQSSVETKHVPSSQSYVLDQRGDNADFTLFDTNHGNCNSIRRMEKEKINHFSSQPCLSSNALPTINDNSGGKNSESFSAHDHNSQRSRRIVNNPSFLQRYEEVKDMPSNQFSSNASGQSSLGSLVRSLDTHPSLLGADQNGTSRNGKLRNEGGDHTTSQEKNNNILSSHGSLIEGSHYKSEQTECNPPSVTVVQEEARDQTSSQFSSYASYHSIFSGFVRSVDAISSLFRSQQKSNVTSQEMNNVVRSSSASRSQQSSGSKVRCNDFPTHKFPTGIESLSSLHSSSITALEPLSSKDCCQLSSHEIETLMDSHPVISGLSKIDSSKAPSSKNSFIKNDMKPTSSKDNPQGSIQVTGSAAGSGLCRYDSSAAAKTSKHEIDIPSSSGHSQRPLQSIKSQVNSNNPEFLQTSLGKQSSLSGIAGAKRTTLSSMSSGTSSSRSDFSSTFTEESKVHTKSNISTFLRDLRPRMTNSGVEICQDSECSRASSVLCDRTNRVSYSPKSCSTRSNSSSSSGSFDMSRDLSNYSMAEVTESSVSDTSLENLVPYGCASILPNSSTDDSYTNAYRKSMSSSTNGQSQSPGSAKYSTSRIPLILSENYSRDDSFAAAYIKSISVSSNDYSPGPPCVLKIPDTSVARRHSSSAIASYKKSTSRLSEFESKVTGDGVEVMKYSTSFAPLLFSGKYSRDGSSSSAYTKSMSVSSSSNDYSLPTPCGWKNPDTSVERDNCSSTISSYNINGSREAFDPLSGFESHVTGDGVEIIEKLGGGSSSTFASHHASSHSTCSAKCSGLPSQASESRSSTTGSNPSRTARQSEKSHSSGIEVSASWLRGSETSSNFSQEESINSSYNSTICKSESQLSGNSSADTSDLQTDSDRMGLCFFSSNVPYSTSTVSHDTDAETC